MTSPKIGIIYQRDKHVGANHVADLTDGDGSLCFCDEVGVELGEALAKEYEQDAHLISYTLEDGDGDQCWARANKKSPFVTELMSEGGRVALHFLTFDFDNHDEQDQKREWESRDEINEWLISMSETGLPEPTYFYTTFHGARLIYVLSEPLNHQEAERVMGGIIRDFSTHGIELDAQCKDWTRLMRLPKTNRPDKGKFYKDENLFMLLDGGPILDPSSIKALESIDYNTAYAEVTEYDAEIPNHEQVRELLFTKTRAGRDCPTDWVKKARTMLTGRISEGVCFNDEPIDVSNGWNNGVLFLIGQIVTMTAREAESSAEGVYALIFSAIEQLQANDEDPTSNWFATSWSMVCRMWANEQAQIMASNREKHESILEGRQIKEDLVEKLREDRPQDVPTGEAEAREWVQRRMVASLGRQHYIMTPEGSYNLRAVQDSLLISMVRDLGMEDVIEITEMKGKTWGYKSTQSILNESSTPITELVCVARQGLAFIEGQRGARELNIPIHQLNPRVQARKSTVVDEWLRALGGDSYELLIDWLAHSLCIDQPICALNLWGSPGTGKGMLAQALAECFEFEQLNDGRVLGKWNKGLLDSPIIFCDEGVPNLKSDESPSVDQAFRSLVSGGSITIRAMNTDPFTARAYPRILFMSNDPDIIRSIVGHRDLTADDVRAIELRLLSLQVSDEALTFLTSKGNYKYTDGWVHGRSRSKYVIASHIRWLYENRRPSQHTSGRLLVEGQTQTQLVRSMRLRSSDAQTVMAALSKLIMNPNKPLGLHESGGYVWATPAGIKKVIDSAFSLNESVSLPHIGRVLRQFSITEEGESGKIRMSQPAGCKVRSRWFQIDLGLLYEEALRYGNPSERIKKLLQQQEGGFERIAYAESQVE